MPRLCDITKPFVPCKLKYTYPSGVTSLYDWDGEYLFWQGVKQVLSHIGLHGQGWSLVPEETIESLCKDAGFSHFLSSSTWGYHRIGNQIWYTEETTIPQVKKIIAFAQEMKQCNK